MSNDRYKFMLGDFECLAIHDVQWDGGTAEMFFPNVSYSDLQMENIDPANISSAMICLAINTGAEWVLLDTGMGFADESSKLAQILKEENIQPDHIIITHLDLDHYAGLINNDQRPSFPTAQVHICRDEWEYFTSKSNHKEDDDRRRHLLLVKDQTHLVDCEGEILPGFHMIPLPGHRKYHMAIEVESNGEKLLFVADTVCHPLHFKHLDWHFSWDSDHEMARESRIKFAQMASESGCLVMGFHFDFPGLGHVVQDGDGWKWQALKI